ncbi:anti-sigma factor [Pedobacter sp. MW01-1-1]|uniref:anti-sigma factor n=1 Tax=Pedobacter sp. MW01-1-1 TaxID=3383027 RepID=UPI003FF11096
MDIKEYISSGIIEAYVMGLASDEEVRILECVQKHSPEVTQAIFDAQQTLEDFASSQAIAPPAALKESIWAKLSEEEEPVVLTDKAIVEEAKTTPLYPSTSINSQKSNVKWYAVAASVLLVASIGLNVYFSNRQKEAETQLADLAKRNQNNALAYQNLKSKWDLVRNGTMNVVPLLGVEKHPDMKATVYFGKQSNEVYLALENLPKAPKDLQYQLWAIVDGKPVSLGVFNQDIATEVQKMTAVKSAQAFAITLEKKGGSPTPTMENMYVLGNV